jgi:HSP20 family protein
MRRWWRILLERIRKLVRRGTAAACLALGILIAVAVPALGAEKSTSTESQTATARVDNAKQSSAERLASVLRDESKSAEERVKEALRLLEQEKASPAAKDEPPSAGDEVDRLPWLDDDWTQPYWGQPFGQACDPWREMQDMRARMDRWFQQAWRRMAEQARQLHQFAGRYSPMGEFEQRDDAYVYRFDLPGVAKDDVKVTVENGRLTIEGKRESRVDETRKGMARREIFYGQFRRDVLLPPDADANNAKTKLENGVLTIEVPRVKSASTATKRTLKIQ